MKNTSTILQVKDGIYDIQPPLTPGLSGLDLFLLVTAITLVLALIFYFTWKTVFSNKGKIRRQIKQLSDAYKNKKINTHDAAYKLSQLLQQGLKINYIGNDIQLPEKLNTRKEDWHDFVDLLSTLRYSKIQDKTPGMSKIFDKSLYWLKVW